MARLPIPGQDDGTWGTILNDFLRQALNDDGSLKPLSQDQITGLTQGLADKAAQADLDTLTNTVAGKAAQSDLDALATTVAGKADASALVNKADVSSVYTKAVSDSRYVQSAAADTTVSGLVGDTSSATHSAVQSIAVGAATTVSVGAVTTGTNVSAGGSAAVTNSGTSTAAVLNFTVPKGDPGDITAATTGTWTATVNLGAGQLASTNTRTLTGNTTLGTLPTPASSVSGTITLVIIQATGSGPYTMSWPSGIKWSNGATAPAMPTTAGAMLVVDLFWTGYAWLGMVAGTY